MPGGKLARQSAATQVPHSASIGDAWQPPTHQPGLFASFLLTSLKNHIMRYLLQSSHIDREKLTIRHMITLYCHANGHGVPGLCSRCSDVLSYAFARIEACCYLPRKKPACGLCQSNCFEVN